MCPPIFSLCFCPAAFLHITILYLPPLFSGSKGGWLIFTKGEQCVYAGRPSRNLMRVRGNFATLIQPCLQWPLIWWALPLWRLGCYAIRSLPSARVALVLLLLSRLESASRQVSGRTHPVPSSGYMWKWKVLPLELGWLETEPPVRKNRSRLMRD